MAPKKKKNKGRGRHSKTPGQTSASNPNPTETSPSSSSPTGDATTTSLVPSSSSPLAPPTTTTTQLIPSAPPQPTSLLPSSPSQITIAPRLRSARPLPIKETHKERISCTSDGATTTDLPVPSIAPSASAASRRTPTLLPITDEFTSVFAPAVAGAMAAMQSVKEEDPAGLQKILGTLFGLRVDQMELVLECLQGMAEDMKGDAELKAALESLADKKLLKITAQMAEMLLIEREKPDGSDCSCGCCEGASGSGEGDDEGGGVRARIDAWFEKFAESRR